MRQYGVDPGRVKQQCFGFGVKLTMADDLGQQISLRGRLEDALEVATEDNRDSVESATLRLILCAVDDRDVSARERGECGGCPETAMRELLVTMARQRRSSAKEYDEAGRIVEAERERSELAVIEAFIPKKLRGDELETAVQAVIEELEAHKLKDMGRCMQALKARYPDRIDTGSAMMAIRSALGG